MKTLSMFLLFTAILICTNVNASYVDRLKTDSLPQNAEFQKLIEQLRTFEPMADEYQSDWIFSVEKDSVIAALKNIYSLAEKFVPGDSSNGELNLFLGLTAHYAYNLNEDDFGPIAEKHFIKANEILEDDYRADWFLALLYVNSGRLLQGMNLLLRLSENYTIEDGIFWEDYAAYSYFSLMPRHAVFGLDKAEKYLGNKSEQEQYFGENIRNSFKLLNVEETIPLNNIWAAQASDTLLSVINLPLGFKITAPRNWQSAPTPFMNKSAAINFKLPPKQGWNSPMTANMIIRIKVVDERESLNDFLSKFLNQLDNKEEIDLNLGLNEISYVGTNKNWYIQEGGARLILCGFERDEPDFSGMELESPGKISKTPQEKYSVQIPPQLFNLRFKGRIFYMIALDSCESIYEDALNDIKKVLKTLIVD